MNLIEEIKKRAIWKYENGAKYHVQTSESGLHSDLYLNTDYVVSDTVLLDKIVDNFAEVIKKDDFQKRIDWVVAYPPFGLPIAYAFARKIGAKFGYVDTKNMLCNFPIKKDELVIVVGDDIYSGGSLKKTVVIIEELGAKVYEKIFSIGNFSNTQKLAGKNIYSILNETGNLYEKSECPMCKIGSISVLPRPNWNKLKK